jgi:hypothetical protein
MAGITIRSAWVPRLFQIAPLPKQSTGVQKQIRSADIRRAYIAASILANIRPFE